MPKCKPKTIEEVLEKRRECYGDFHLFAKVSQQIKFDFNNTPNWISLSKDKQEALEMIGHKISRILTGDPEYKDSWTDIQGYAKLISDTLKDETNE